MTEIYIEASYKSGYQDEYHPKYPDVQVTGVLITPVRVPTNSEVPGYDCSAPKSVRIPSV